jgi:hypothetical protein
MEKMCGKPLTDMWDDIHFSAKATLYRQLASFCTETFQQQMNRVGNLFPAPGDDMIHLKIGRIISTVFIWDDHTYQDVPRGPFRSSKDWLSARLSLA